MGNNWEKSNIAIAILKKLPFLTKMISYFCGSNNIFADCMYIYCIMNSSYFRKYQSNYIRRLLEWILLERAIFLN